MTKKVSITILCHHIHYKLPSDHFSKTTFCNFREKHYMCHSSSQKKDKSTIVHIRKLCSMDIMDITQFLDQGSFSI